jgi:hypothetical protein
MKDPPLPLSERTLKLFRDNPSKALSIDEVIDGLGGGIKNNTVRYHVIKWWHVGALEKRPGYRFAASASWKTPQEIRAIVAEKIKETPRVVVGEDWKPGAQPNAINVAPHYGHLIKWIASIQDRMVPPYFSDRDREAIDEIVRRAFPSMENERRP